MKPFSPPSTVEESNFQWMASQSNLLSHSGPSYLTLLTSVLSSEKNDSKKSVTGGLCASLLGSPMRLLHDVRVREQNYDETTRELVENVCKRENWKEGLSPTESRLLDLAVLDFLSPDKPKPESEPPRQVPRLDKEEPWLEDEFASPTDETTVRTVAPTFWWQKTQ